MDESARVARVRKVAIFLILQGSLELAVALIGGALKLGAGRRNRALKDRGLGIAALLSGLVSLGTCYCFPSALVLLIWGLRVYSDPEVRRAFGEPITTPGH